MKQLSNIYAQLDNIVCNHIENQSLDQLSEDFQKEYFALRDDIITELSSLLTSQFNYDKSISKQEKKEIAQLIEVYFETIEAMSEHPIQPLFSIQNKIEDVLIDKYMNMCGYEKNNQGEWQMKRED